MRYRREEIPPPLLSLSGYAQLDCAAIREYTDILSILETNLQSHVTIFISTDSEAKYEVPFSVPFPSPRCPHLSNLNCTNPPSLPLPSTRVFPFLSPPRSISFWTVHRRPQTKPQPRNRQHDSTDISLCSSLFFLITRPPLPALQSEACACPSDV